MSLNSSTYYLETILCYGAKVALPVGSVEIPNGSQIHFAFYRQKWAKTQTNSD